MLQGTDFAVGCEAKEVRVGIGCPWGYPLASSLYSSPVKVSTTCHMRSSI